MKFQHAATGNGFFERLAAASAVQGRRIGGMLLLDAVRRSLRLELGWAFIVVEARNDRAARSHERFSVLRFPAPPLSPWLDRKQAVSLVETRQGGGGQAVPACHAGVLRVLPFTCWPDGLLSGGAPHAPGHPPPCGPGVPRLESRRTPPGGPEASGHPPFFPPAASQGTTSGTCGDFLGRGAVERANRSGPRPQ